MKILESHAVTALIALAVGVLYPQPKMLMVCIVLMATYTIFKHYPKPLRRPKHLIKDEGLVVIPITQNPYRQRAYVSELREALLSGKAVRTETPGAWGKSRQIQAEKKGVRS